MHSLNRRKQDEEVVEEEAETDKLEVGSVVAEDLEAEGLEEDFVAEEDRIEFVVIVSQFS